MSKSIWVYADWDSMPEPLQVGMLEVDLVRGAEVYRFAYTDSWLDSLYAVQIDPLLKMIS